MQYQALLASAIFSACSFVAAVPIAAPIAAPIPAPVAEPQLRQLIQQFLSGAGGAGGAGGAPGAPGGGAGGLSGISSQILTALQPLLGGLANANDREKEQMRQLVDAAIAAET